MAEALTDVGKLERDFNVAEDGPGVFDELRRLLSRVQVAASRSTMPISPPQWWRAGSRAC